MVQIEGDRIAALGVTEPSGGSDVANLKTTAVRDGDHYVVNGQKTWTTLGQHADWIFCLVRTDPDVPKHDGITMMVIDMHADGVEVRPLKMTSGNSEFNEVFFDDVFVPDDDVVGPVDGGWTVAKALLGHERSMIADIRWLTDLFDSLVALARRARTPSGESAMLAPCAKCIPNPPSI